MNAKFLRLPGGLPPVAVLSSTLRSAAAALALGLATWVAQAQTQTMVRLHTALGPVDIELYDSAAPLTVANFLGYVRSGAYDNSFIHRSVSGFVIQGGGYNWKNGAPAKVPAGPAVKNEFSASRSNLRGTVAMAKLGGNPDSATTEWFFNLANNASNLDAQNGGFTVFGKVTTPGMAVVDAMAALQVVNAGGAFANLPLLRLPPDRNPIGANELVMVSRAEQLPQKSLWSDADRIFNYLEAAYPQYASPASAATATFDGYTYRFYANTNTYAGVKDGKVWYLVPSISNQLQYLATVEELLAQARAAGY